MLTAVIKKQIRSSFEAAKIQLPNFSNRSSQNKMIAEIAKTLSGEYTKLNPILCVEAPTGTGKTMAYLISCLPIAKANKKKLIIACANVALQEQILYKDIVEAKKFSSVEFEFAIAKGRSRYVCIRNLINLTEETSNTQMLFEDALLWDEPPSQSQLKKLSEMTDNYSSTRWSGEIDDLESPPEFSLWQKVACNRFTCTAKNCEFYNDCAFFKARKKASQADVIIANHDLILADIINGNNILPDVNDCIFVFDEAHHFSQKALAHFSINTSTEFMKTTIRQSQSSIDQISKITKQKTSESHIKKADEAIGELIEVITNFEYLDDVYLFDMSGVSSDVANLGKNLLTIFNTAFGNFLDQKDNWQDYCKRNTVQQTTMDNLNNIIGQNEQNLSSIVSLLNAFTKNTHTDTPPTSNWIVKSKLSNKKTNYHLNTAKIDVSNHLQSLIWSKAAGVILTSATLTSLGSFDRMNQQLGLEAKENRYLRLASPFNHKSVDFIVANIKASPSEVFEHTQELARELKKRINKKSQP